jgi:hypothetical protein
MNFTNFYVNVSPFQRQVQAILQAKEAEEI